MPKKSSALRLRRPRARGILLTVGKKDIEPDKARRLAQNIVRELRGNWQLNPLGQSGRDFEICKPKGMKAPSIGRLWELATELQQHDDVFVCDPSLDLPNQTVPAVQSHLQCSDPPEYEWSLEICRVPQAWSLNPPAGGKQRGEGIRIAHLDTGYTNHPEIVNDGRLLVADGYDFFNGDSNPTDPLTGPFPGHGTSTASVIMSDVGGTLAAWVSGVAPEAELVPLRVTDSVLICRYGPLIDAIDWAIQKKCHVVSISLGTTWSPDAFCFAIWRAIDANMIVLAAAGNKVPWVVDPAAYDAVVALAASNCQNHVWQDSSGGRQVDVSAPGESVWRALTTPAGQYDVDRSSGTSYSTATVAGACALWLAYWGPKLRKAYPSIPFAAAFKHILKTDGVRTPQGWNTRRYGTGILDAERLLAAKLPPQSKIPALDHTECWPKAKLDKITLSFPDTKQRKLQETLARLLRTDVKHLPEVLEVIGDELAFHVATNPAVRTAIVREAQSQRINGARLRRSLEADSVFRRHASRTLKSRIR